MIEKSRLFLKKIIFYLTKGSQVYLSNKSSYARTLSFLPSFESKTDLCDQISRLRWYIPERYLNKDITVLVNERLRGSIKNLSYPKSHRKNPVPDVLSRINIKYVKNDYTIPSSDILCIWKFSFLSFFRLITLKLFSLRIIDPNFYKYTESHTYPALLWYDLYTYKERSHLKKHSKGLFGKFYVENKSEKVILFGTGPSINSVINKDYSDKTTIICNSIVKDDTLLEKIRPNAITFIDSVFHFGVSLYCERFISDLIKTVNKFESYCFVNEVGGALIYEHYPGLRKKLICFPTYRTGGPNRIKPNNFKSRFYSQSVVTRIMLQLGAGLADKILMCGFDGRSKGEDYFWKHSPTVQYTNLMQSVWDSHPTFFANTKYEDNYNEHCKVMEKVISSLEKKGAEIYTLEKSYIPALAIRNYKKVS